MTAGRGFVIQSNEDARAMTPRELELEMGDGIVVLYFWAGWCGPCTGIQDQAMKTLPPAILGKVIKINVDESSDLAILYRISSIPTVVIINGGKERHRFVGVTSGKDIANAIARLQTTHS